ncbi:hypothetical protein BJX99DRAFT_264363 [Aspergillus californicus]
MNLKRLSFDPENMFYTKSDTRWGKLARGIYRDCGPCQLEVQFENFEMDLEIDFLAFLSRHHRTLRKLVLRNISLLDRGCEPILRALRDGFPALVDITFSDLGWRDRRLHFPGIVADSCVDEVTGSRFVYANNQFGANLEAHGYTRVSYSGPNIDIALDKLLDWSMYYESQAYY